MNNHTSNGDDLYFRVLFPTVGSEGSAIWLIDPDELDDLHANEESLARDVCRMLWQEREIARTTATSADVRRLPIRIDHPVVGNVTVGICLDCPWIVWDRVLWAEDHPWNYEREHPDGCLQGAKQCPDLGTDGDARPLRITPSAGNLHAESWGPYYDLLTPRRIVRSGYGLVGRTNHGARQAKSLWEQRESRRLEIAAEEIFLDDHGGVALQCSYETLVGDQWQVVFKGYAACLGCTWIEFVACSVDDPDWIKTALERATIHALDPQPSDRTGTEPPDELL